jgi:hypothetical protein
VRPDNLGMKVSDEAAATVVESALGTYCLLLEEIAAGGKVLIRRRDGRTFEIIIDD